MSSLKKKNYKNPPPEVAKLVQKFKGNRTAAARAIGYTYVGALNEFGHRKKPLPDKVLENIKKALRGEPVEAMGTTRVGKVSAKASLTILLVKSAYYERLHDLAMVMGGQWKFKKHLGKEWLAILAMPAGDLEDFITIAKKRGADIIPV